MNDFGVRLRKHWLDWLAILIVLATLLLIGLIASGRLDPQPIGQPQASLILSGQSVAAGQEQASWLDEVVPTTHCSLKLTAAYKSGEQDIGYGLLVGQPEAYLGVAVSPLGYLTIWQGTGGEGEAAEVRILPWQTWPHIRQGTGRNEIWLNIAGDDVTIRLNGELLWQGTVAFAGQQTGLWLESFGQAAVVDFQRLEIFY